jgi:hypothetical protein
MSQPLRRPTQHAANIPSWVNVAIKSLKRDSPAVHMHLLQSLLPHSLHCVNIRPIKRPQNLLTNADLTAMGGLAGHCNLVSYHAGPLHDSHNRVPSPPFRPTAFPDDSTTAALCASCCAPLLHGEILQEVTTHEFPWLKADNLHLKHLQSRNAKCIFSSCEA